MFVAGRIATGPRQRGYVLTAYSSTCRLPTYHDRSARRPVRQPRADGPQDPRSPRSLARLPDRPPDRADQRQPARHEPGHALSRAAENRAGRVDLGEVGRVRERSQGEALCADSRRPEAAPGAGSGMAAGDRDRGALLPHTGGPLMTRLRILLARLRG